MDRYAETFETWNKVAKQYEDKFMDLDLYNETYAFFCASIPSENAHILDLGCGPGNITKYLLTNRPDFTILGIDVAPQMVELAKKNNPTAKFSVMDVRKINKLKASFDGIVCGFCLPYLSESDCREFIFNCSRLLHDHGIIYLSFVEGDLDKSHFQVRSNGDRVYFYYHPIDQIKNLLTQHGFSELRAFQVEYQKGETELEIHTILTARKTTN
ncbi:class I SAM-dependent DNA methyltransferase [Namhaeicola litoreus]|uniref:Class I SAM-dependent DNA methyltransferase n=1 Tax=Namhaeicola litoreus TaxID=1052145 RepID=A0ABW3Y4V8_9FLAO